ncbi:DUF3093 domain-containing protein [Nesterenkonia muleiensis]|uniref:DUF3093 domain-containing protein n=1 Tax=Nesterenkonia muleiensis TaxID=2282648 RepID=UPI000E73CAD6|nr:DUF3093 domain-containing protein [Nesterenkonia muleiensis]
MNDSVRYAERLWPAWWIWLSVVIIGSSFSTIFFPIGVTYGVIALIVGAVLAVVALMAITPRVEVTDQWLRAGRAQIEREHLGHVVAHRGAAAREQLGPGFDARSYQCVRGWISPVLTAEITDPRDATPYWLISTRHPERLLAALGSQEQVRVSGVSMSEN